MIKELDKEIVGKGEVNGYHFKLVKRNGYAYMYAQYLTETGQFVTYEVFERKVNTYFECVSYPTSNSFGLWAEQTPVREEADKFYDRFTNRVKNRLKNKENENI